jgi:hypothetical protein
VLVFYARGGGLLGAGADRLAAKFCADAVRLVIFERRRVGLLFSDTELRQHVKNLFALDL